jgi:hypothetical protein
LPGYKYLFSLCKKFPSTHANRRWQVFPCRLGAIHGREFVCRTWAAEAMYLLVDFTVLQVPFAGACHAYVRFVHHMREPGRVADSKTNIRNRKTSKRKKSNPTIKLNHRWTQINTDTKPIISKTNDYESQSA